MRRIVATLFLCASLVPAAASAEVATHLTPAEADGIFRIANDACLREEWEKCVDGYHRLLDGGYSGSDLYYNLGTAHLRQGRLGHAILNLERALRLDPSDEDARANLERARRMRVDKLVGSPEESGHGDSLASRIASRTRGELFAAAFLGLWTVGGLLLVTRRLLGRPGLFAALGGLALLASIPAGAVTLAHAWVRSQAHEAVVIAATAPVRDGPQDGLKPSFELHEGLKVRLFEQEGPYRRIRLANGLEGWIPIDAVEEIEPERG